MADRPVIFSAPMVRALLAGTKTQTRRILKPQPPEGYVYTGVHYASYEPSSWFFNGPRSGHKVRQIFDEGDLLWVKEEAHRSPDLWSYSADGAEVPWPGRADLADRKRDVCSSLFLPRSCSRLTLTVTEVRVERLHDIREADAIAEGLRPDSCGGQRMWDPGPPHGLFGDPRIAYRMIWEDINGAGSWAANPWVAAISFSTTPANIDSLPEQP